MSKPRFQISLLVDTVAHANTIKTNIQAQLAGKDIFEDLGVFGFLNESGNIQMNASWRFNNSVDRDSLRSWLQDQIQNSPQVKVWTLAGSKIYWHVCSHDDASVQDCNLTSYGEFSK